MCYNLVWELQRQLSACNEKYEIIVAEDGSDNQETIRENDKVTMLPGCVHLVRKENIGRAHIINYLVREAKGEWCVIMDSDAEVVSDDYISKYTKCMADGADVFVGDLVNPDSLPQADATLRYKYEKAAERFRTAEFRNRHPFERFCTFNFMARRDTLLEVPFDERCTEYGYEDTLMGLELKRHGKRVSHIDNPLRHLGFDANAVFLRNRDSVAYIEEDRGKSFAIYGTGEIGAKNKNCSSYSAGKGHLSTFKTVAET